jgi:putative flippase GtrA
MLKTHFSVKNKTYIQFFKYGLISAFGYGFMFFMMYFFVDIILMPKTTSFFITYLLAYIIVYFINLKFLFVKDHSWLNIIRFCLHTIFFLSCGSFLFSVFLELKMNYLIATVLVALTLFPVRFLAQKIFVFK